jgi:hypothetical protein
VAFLQDEREGTLHKPVVIGRKRHRHKNFILQNETENDVVVQMTKGNGKKWRIVKIKRRDCRMKPSPSQVAVATCVSHNNKTRHNTNTPTQ